MVKSKIMVSTALLRDFIVFADKYGRFPKLELILKSFPCYVNELFLGSCAMLPDFKTEVKKFYTEVCLKLKLALNSELEIDPNAASKQDIYRLDAGYLHSNKYYYRNYPPLFKTISAKNEVDILGDIRQVMSYRLLEKMQSVAQKIVPFFIDLLLMIIRSPPHSKEAKWIVIAPAWTHKYYKKAEAYLKKHIQYDEFDTALNYVMQTPAEFCLKHSEDITIFRDSPRDPDIYHNLNLYAPNEDNGGINPKPERIREKIYLQNLSVKRWEELAYTFPVELILKHIILDQQKLKKEFRDPRALHEKNRKKPPLIFVLTPNITRSLFEYYFLSRHKFPPIIKQLCANNYVKLAVFKEYINPILPGDLLADLATFLDLLYLPSINSTNSIKESNSDETILQKGLDETKDRYQALIKLFNGLSKEKQKEFGVPVGILGSHQDHTHCGSCFTPKRAIQYIFDAFKLDFRSQMQSEQAIYAFGKPPSTLSDNATFYIHSEDRAHKYSSVNSVKKVYRALNIDHPHILWSAIFNNALSNIEGEYTEKTVTDAPDVVVDALSECINSETKKIEQDRVKNRAAQKMKNTGKKIIDYFKEPFDP
ncbi:MAG: hypothetical protein GF364_08090, partial [Candidatus Lokiarchaeota archaeon]|nr:hypothetical protein [Candidatus Lokiarchaeota archaeon]